MPEQFEPGPPTPEMPESMPETVRDPEMHAAFRYLDESMETYLQRMRSGPEATRKNSRDLYDEAVEMRSFLARAEADVALGWSKNWRESIQGALEAFPEMAEKAFDRGDDEEGEELQREGQIVEKYSKVLTPETLRRYMP